jgi:two-component system NtrC family response regulator
VREQIRRAAPLDVPVLVLGESGVGKELVAAEVHRRSERSGSFVPVNCAALAASLVESELFGHTKGAFTGATAASDGLFGEADGGTILLDEIGEMPMEMQSKLLRVLATGEVRPVGAANTRTVDVRVVAATNVDLRAAADAGRFRGDLYSRLLGATIEMPPLRERRDDILRLARHFLNDSSIEITPDAAEALLVHRWEFNVRELSQVITTLAPDAGKRRQLDIDLLPEHIRGGVVRASSDIRASVDAPIWLRIRRDGTPTAEELREVVVHYSGNIHHVAEFFGKDRKQIYRWLERHEITLDAFRGEGS